MHVPATCINPASFYTHQPVLAGRSVRYLDTLEKAGFLHKQRLGRSNYYVNVALAPILIQAERATG